MPKITFLNLPKTKKAKLVNAIWSEIGEMPFEKVSINKIVQKAEIPRGSFYQYFEDKYDMLSYVLSEFMDKMLEKMYIGLVSNNGDIFKMFYEMFDFTVAFAQKSENKNVCKHLFSDPKVITALSRNSICSKERSERIQCLKEKVNMTLLDIRSDKDFENMVKILFSVVRDSTVETFLNNKDCEKHKQDFQLKLELIKRGFLNKERDINA